MTYFTKLSADEIGAILRKVRYCLEFRTHRMGDRDIDFFRDIERKLGEKGRTTMTVAQLNWFFEASNKAMRKKRDYAVWMAPPAASLVLT